jgi:hypothetical protein
MGTYGTYGSNYLDHIRHICNYMLDYFHIQYVASLRYAGMNLVFHPLSSSASKLTPWIIPGVHSSCICYLAFNIHDNEPELISISLLLLYVLSEHVIFSPLGEICLVIRTNQVCAALPATTLAYNIFIIGSLSRKAYTQRKTFRNIEQFIVSGSMNLLPFV